MVKYFVFLLVVVIVVANVIAPMITFDTTITALHAIGDAANSAAPMPNPLFDIFMELSKHVR